MNVTGQQFDMDLKTFTLGNMFAMQLQQHAAAIASITSGAVKELTIESELKKMADVWKEQRFELHKYTHVRTAPLHVTLSSSCRHTHHGICNLHALATVS